MDARMRRLLLRQLDKRVESLDAPRIPGGWVRSVRMSLGMTQGELGHRLNTTQQGVERLERAEVDRNISLARLERAAEALGGRLVYAIVPREDKTFTDLLRRHARAAAEIRMDRVERTMVLEDQGSDAESYALNVEELTEELFRTFSREIWEPR